MSMTARELAVTGIRLLAIYLAIQGVVVLPHTFSEGVRLEWYIETFPLFWLYTIGGMVAPLLVGLILWMVAEPLARKMIGVSSSTDPDSVVTGFELPAIAISIAGFLLVITNLPSLVSQIWYLYDSSSVVSGIASDERLFVKGMISNVVGSGLQILLGALLVTHSKLWARLLYWIRNHPVHVREFSRHLKCSLT